MTFNFAPWALDGARTPAALARVAAYASGGGRSGVVTPTSLKVLPLSVPGNGLRVQAGSGVVLNGYITNPDQAYIVSNPGEHTVLSGDMPAASGVTQHFLVAVVVGDTEYDQTGHPFMPTTLTAEEAPDYEYVRVVVVPCTSTTKTFSELGLFYPGLALARLTIPPSTTTITAPMITDLRQLSQPRSERVVRSGIVGAGEALTSPTFATWPNWQPDIDIPAWATRATMTVSISGALAYGASSGHLKASLGALSGWEVGYDVVLPSIDTASRQTFVYGAAGSVLAQAGTTVQVALQGRRTTGGPGYITTYDGISFQVVIDIQFYQDPI